MLARLRRALGRLPPPAFSPPLLRGEGWVLATTFRFLTLARLRRAFGRLPAPEFLLFAGPRRRRSGGEQRSWPAGRRAGCPESREGTKRNGLFNPSELQAAWCRGCWSCSRLHDLRDGHAAPYLETEGAKSREASLCLALLWLLHLRAGSALLFRGPSVAVRRGRRGRAAGIAKEGDTFSTGQESGRKARPRLTHSEGRKPGERHRGVLFLFGYFLFEHAKRKLLGRRQASETALLLATGGRNSSVANIKGQAVLRPQRLDTPWLPCLQGRAREG